MKYIKYENFDILNGIGARCVLWLSKCSHGCAGCFNNDSWGNVGEVVTREFKDKILSDLDNYFINGITFSGGDPLHKSQFKEVIEFSKEIKSKLPNKNIWLYTGYTLQQIQDDPERKEILSIIDYLVDGKFEIEHKVKGKFFGSSNQKIYKIVNGIATFDENLN